MSNNNLKNATMAAVLTAVIVTPVFGLQLIRQGARTSMESHWSLVALAAAVVFVFQLLRPWIAKPFQKLKTNLPTLPSAPAKNNKLCLLYTSHGESKAPRGFFLRFHVLVAPIRHD